MIDPVTILGCGDGVFERNAIEKHLKGSDLSPISNQKLMSKHLIGDFELKMKIDQYKKKIGNVSQVEGNIGNRNDTSLL